MATKASILGAVRQLCETESPSAIAAGMDVFLSTALAQYSRDRPNESVADVAGDDANLLTKPSGWQARWSVIRKIVYPYVDEDSSVLEADDYVVDTIPVGGSAIEKIRFHHHSPASTETVRVWFTKPHSLNDSTCTVYAQDADAFASLVAHVIERKKASLFLALKDQGLQADLVDYGSKANEARGLAKMHLESYREGLGLSADGPVAASVAGDIDVEPQYPYVSHMRHHRARER